ncbi:hypothetical protein [Nannocystis bainbridge]|uniref:Uncharacterized protein n=1 Tax=Nannocystis bainbridge TaxID=2995303 RepID=A0ABT5EDW9_9BACT|nr:hypothetical protein [Nannocystis bainbridge]MDC0723605.1 hypothetical protein [Nannocystis bainbridge]
MHHRTRIFASLLGIAMMTTTVATAQASAAGDKGKTTEKIAQPTPDEPTAPPAPEPKPQPTPEPKPPKPKGPNPSPSPTPPPAPTPP